MISWAKTVAAALVAYVGFTTLAFAHYSIPSESMVPTLEVGDRIVVNKFAYGYSRHSLALGIGVLLPRSEHRLFERDPLRGDVVVFAHPYTGRTTIKRLVGLPNDVIEVRDGRLSINGAEVGSSEPVFATRARHEHDDAEALFAREEMLPDGVAHPVHELPTLNPLRNFGPYRVPPGYVFMMGDNRDNSLDSRWEGTGPVPMENLIGRAETVYFAPRACTPSDAACRRRWLRPMHD
jgi:signal peptidase I